ncbi:toxin-antitoxin system HicB family antitoxin [Azotobacter chroococcum]
MAFFNGLLSLRMAPELHASISAKAMLSNKSINQWVVDVLDRETHA